MKETIDLPNVTMVIVDTVDYPGASMAILKSLEHITPARTIFFTDITYPHKDRFEVINIKHLFSKEDYSEWIIKELGKQDITTSHILIIQADGYVIDGEAWNDKFLEFDLIGSPWLYVDGRNVGNGGMTLRSTRLHKILAEDDHIGGYHPEDDCIARGYRPYLEDVHGIKFAPEALSHTFAFELNEPTQSTFGFHGKFHKPYRETVVIRRQAALGDLVQLEPVLEFFHINGFRVVLDTLPQFYGLFAFHKFPVEDYAKFNKKVRHRVIDLNMGYETIPQQLHLKSYFESAGCHGFTLRNPRLYFSGQNKLFQRYIVVHIDERETNTRNVIGIDWVQIRNYIESKGVTVIQIGKGVSEEAGLRFNTVNENLMFWLLAGADLFVGIDSGPSNVAVALGIKSLIFFGSVNPEYIYHDLSNIVPMKSDCPIKKDSCWHSVIGCTGVPCEVDVEYPPCTLISTKKLMYELKKLI